MTAIVHARLDLIDPNSHRNLQTYPFNPKKLKSLQRSIDEVGFWEGVIARKSGRRYEIAFGHHRVEAAKREGLKTIPLIVRDLDDDDMLAFMGLENLEDYNADFLVQLNTWDAAVKRWGDLHEDHDVEGPGIARLICWTRERVSGSGTASLMNATAAACDAAWRAINAGYLKRSEFKGMSIRQAAEVAQPLMARVDAAEKQRNKHGDAAVEKVKKQVAGAAQTTARRVRAGTVKTKDIRSSIDKHTHHEARKSRKPTPLFTNYAKGTAKRIAAMLENDATAEHLEEMKVVRNKVTLEEDFRALARIDFELSELIERAEYWRKQLRPTNKSKVIDFRRAKKALLAARGE